MEKKNKTRINSKNRGWDGIIVIPSAVIVSPILTVLIYYFCMYRGFGDAEFLCGLPHGGACFDDIPGEFGSPVLRQPLHDEMTSPQLVSRGFLVHLYAAGAGCMLFRAPAGGGNRAAARAAPPPGGGPLRGRPLRRPPVGGAAARPFPRRKSAGTCRPPLAPPFKICYTTISLPPKRPGCVKKRKRR